jgi:hypothetical protein
MPRRTVGSSAQPIHFNTRRQLMPRGTSNEYGAYEQCRLSIHLLHVLLPDQKSSNAAARSQV